MMKQMKIAILNGAGLSVESGLPTYRGPEGLYTSAEGKKLTFSILANKEGFKKYRKEALDFYNKRRANLLEVMPNRAHEMIAGLERDERFDVTVITQNVDNLQELAGTKNIIHLHGLLTRVCYADTNGFPALDETIEFPLDRPIGLSERIDGHLLRPWAFFFGEKYKEENDVLSDATSIYGAADVVLVVGTSFTVTPAAMLTAHRDARKFCIDPADVELGFASDWTHIKATAVEGLPVFLKELDNLYEQYCMR